MLYTLYKIHYTDFMSLKTRRIIYISLIIFFLIATPCVLLYSQGYSYDWQKNKLVATGGFYLKSYPTGAKIFINDKQDNKTPRLISRLLPKDYKIKVVKDGFYPWQKNLKIESRLVIEARNILLVPEKPKVKIVEEKLFSDFSFKSFSLEENELKKIQQANSTIKNVLKSDSSAFVNDKIFYLEPGSYLLYSSDITGADKQQISLSPLPADVYKILAAPNQQSFAALSTNGRLYLLDPENGVFDLVEIGVKNASISPDSKKLLYYNETEIWVKYLEKILIQPYHEAGEKELITRFSEKISSAIWYPEDNEHIIFIVGNTIKITELDGRDQRNTYDFLATRNAFIPSSWSNPQLYYNTEKELLYFISDDKLYSAQIKVPQPIIETNGWFYGK